MNVEKLKRECNELGITNLDFFEQFVTSHSRHTVISDYQIHFQFLNKFVERTQVLFTYFRSMEISTFKIENDMRNNLTLTKSDEDFS